MKWYPQDGDTMPLIKHLKEGFEANKPTAWHRNEERRARGLWPVNPATQLEGWERELVWMEILVLTGNSETSFRHLARAWGRDKGFHMVLAHFICKRRGDVERKQREPLDEEKISPNKSRELSECESDSVWDISSYEDATLSEAIAAGFLDFDSDEDDYTPLNARSQQANQEMYLAEDYSFLVNSSSLNSQADNAGEINETVSSMTSAV